MGKNGKNDRQLWAKIIAKAWSDDGFKKKLVQNPRAILEEYGIHCEPKKEYRLLESSGEIEYLVLPAKLYQSKELTEEDLRSLAAGDCMCASF